MDRRQLMQARACHEIARLHRVDEPASDELNRAEELASMLAKRLASAERANIASVAIPIESAKELCQLLHDSIRTARQLAGKRQ